MISVTIYAIIDDGYFYIGSTKKTLEEMLKQHRNASKFLSYKYSKLYNYINNIRGNRNYLKSSELLKE
jgi:hypothetical protein